MSMPIASVYDNVLTALQLHDNDTLDQVIRCVQQNYYQLCEKKDWVSLRRKLDITYVTDTPYLLPANLIGITKIEDADENEYFPASYQQNELSANHRGWFFHPDEVAPLYVGKAIDIEQDASVATITSRTVAASEVGEYFMVEDEPGFYKLTSVAGAFTPVYRGPRKQDNIFILRPPTTKKVVLVDEYGDAADSGTYTLWYWVYPEPLYHSWQIPLLPAIKALELATIIDMLRLKAKQTKEAQQYRDDYRLALSEMMGMNKPPLAQQQPRANYDLTRTFGRR